MCFGPTASFSSSIILGIIGVANLKSIKSKHELMFAAIPLIFAIHQFIEGLLWLTLVLGNYQMTQSWLTLGFLFIALLFWPIYSPLSIYLIEKDANRRKLILPFIWLGFALGSYMVVNLIKHPHSARVISCSIYYDFTLPVSEIYMAILYLIAVFGSALVSSEKFIRRIGILNIIFCAISALVYYKAFISVWCFFAALLSVIIYLHFREPAKKHPVNLQS